jgi:hypothetical protein
MKKKILIGLGLVLLVIQFIRPARNESGDDTNHIATQYSFPGNVAPLVEKACYDCHSNKTVYPWYSNIQPVGWLLANHVNEGKEHLNFSTFATYSREDQAHVFEEIVEVVKEGEMPLKSYTFNGFHPEAKLTDDQRTIITSWAQEQRNVALNPPAPAMPEMPAGSGEEGENGDKD